MMDRSLDTIMLGIADGTLIPAGYYAELDCDDILNRRDDDDEFVEEWSRLFEEVKQQWDEADIAVEAREQAEELRQAAFLAVGEATNNHEIAGYVSDDIDLITRAELLGMSAPLLDRLWDAYQGGAFPHPPFNS